MCVCVYLADCLCHIERNKKKTFKNCGWYRFNP